MVNKEEQSDERFLDTLDFLALSYKHAHTETIGVFMSIPIDVLSVCVCVCADCLVVKLGCVKSMLRGGIGK